RAVSKDDPRVETFGTVDELNAVLGIVRCYNTEKLPSARRDGFDAILQAIQHRLFDLGAELATHPDDRYEGQRLISEADVAWLERVIDTMNAELPPLDSFVLPGGGALNSFLHQARTVCRRGERIAVTLGRTEEVGAQALAYLNRLSDALFVFSRWVAATMGEREILWEQGQQADDSWHRW
ncbi:MAG: cob(I)yrinic acid a,c-diamide adenosyltransferase, partial [bacterium]